MRSSKVLWTLVVAAAVSATAEDFAFANRAQIIDRYESLPLHFEQRAYGEFVGRGSAYAVRLRRGQVLVTTADGRRARLQFKGAASSIVPAAFEALPVVTNYFVGNDPTKWRANVSSFGKVRYAGVDRGIDVVFYGRGRDLEFDVTVAPGANPSKFRFTIDGASVAQTASGDLRVGQSLTLHKPNIFQIIDGSKQRVDGSYVLLPRNEIGFHISRYDRAKRLVIDPDYTVSLGGTAADAALAVALDSAGNAYVTGWTASTDFPTLGAEQSASGGGKDVFVTKINPSGTAFVYSTYLGGNGDDIGNAIAVDGSGNAYVAGSTTSTNFPLSGALQGAQTGGAGFLTKLNSSGSALVYSTYYGNNGIAVNALAVDTSGNAYIAGVTYGFVTVSPIQSVYGGNGDAFAAKINPSGSAAVWSTYIGGNEADVANGIAVDSSGNAYVAGTTGSSNFPTVSALQPTGGGGAFRTTDGGGTWPVTNSGLVRAGISSTVFDPTNASVVYAAGLRYAYKSTDGGLHWAQIIDGTTYFIGGLAVDPVNTQIVYARDSFGSGVLKSTDGGASFTGANTGLVNRNVTALAVDPSNDAKVIAGTGGGIYTSTNSAGSWTQTSATTNSIYDIKFDGVGNVYAATSRGTVLKSIDGGSTWASASTGLPFTNVNGIAVNPANAGNVLAATSRGLYQTTTGGTSWTLLNVNGANFVSYWPKTTQSIVFGGSNGMYESTDGGTTWNRLKPNSTLSGFAYAPSSVNTALVGTDQTDAFITKINPTGNAFTFSTYFGGSGDDSAADIALLPSGNGIAIAGTTSSIDLPIAANQSAFAGGQTDAFVASIVSTGSSVSFLSYYGGSGDETATGVGVDANGLISAVGYTTSTDLPVMRAQTASGGAANMYATFDGGVSWLAAPAPGPTIAINPLSTNEMYAAAAANAYHSTDGGNTWTVLSNAPAGILGIAVAYDGSVYAATHSGISHSTDNGSTWTSVLSQTFATVYAFRTLLLTPPTTALFVATDVGLFRSMDSGATWATPASGLPTTETDDVQFDPWNSRYMYAALPVGIYRSSDIGATWTATATLVGGVAPYHLAVDTSSPFLYGDADNSGIVDQTDIQLIGAYLYGGAAAPPGSLDATANGTVDGLDVFYLVNGIYGNGSGVQATPSSVYVGSNGGGMYKNTTNGSWSQLTSTGLTSSNIQSLATCGSPSTLFAGTDRSLFSSGDGGSTWSRAGMTNISVGQITADPYNTPAASPVRVAGQGGHSGFAVTLNPAVTPSLVYASYFGGSADAVAGKAWVTTDSQLYITAATAANDSSATRIQSIPPQVEINSQRTIRPDSAAGHTTPNDCLIRHAFNDGVPRADVAVDGLTNTPLHPTYGQTIQITAVVANHGPDASGVTANSWYDFLTNASITVSQGTCSPALFNSRSGWTCQLGVLEPSTTVTISISGTYVWQSQYHDVTSIWAYRMSEAPERDPEVSVSANGSVEDPKPANNSREIKFYPN